VEDVLDVLVDERVEAVEAVDAEELLVVLVCGRVL